MNRHQRHKGKLEYHSDTVGEMTVVSPQTVARMESNEWISEIFMKYNHLDLVSDWIWELRGREASEMTPFVSIMPQS